jgi:hypothetical protein
MAAVAPSAKVLVTGAGGQIAYSLMPLICSGQMLGASTPITLHLLDIPGTESVLEGKSDQGVSLGVKGQDRTRGGTPNTQVAPWPLGPIRVPKYVYLRS